MSPTLEACLRSWPFAPWLLVALFLSAAIYLRGWIVLRRRYHIFIDDPLRETGSTRGASRLHSGHLAAHLGGLTAIYLALASPIEPVAGLLLQVHMLQHLLLMMVAAPLVWLGAPMLPMLRGLPRPILVYWVAPLFASRPLRRLFGRLTHPLTALPVFVATTWLWHFPPLYDLALRSGGWHYAQHACFLGAALLFWYPVVRPYPSRPRWSPWLLLPCLLLADVSNTVLSAVLTFSERALYPYYDEVPRIAGISVLGDQAAAGVLMWVPGSIAFLVPLFAIGVRLLSGDGSRVWSQNSRPLAARISLPILNHSAAPDFRRQSPGFDLLRVPLIGQFLKWRHARRCLQLSLLLLAGLVIFDGLRGPQVGATNLAGVLPWIHWRGLLVLGLLVSGNVFCMACPFTLPRTFARRWLPRGRPWPRWLRSKWLAAGLVAVFLWSYEAFALWDSPWVTAWIAIGYFAAAFVVDSFFSGAAFCKYVCPIGQFNFVQALVSPIEVKVREPSVCATCNTKECIRGSVAIPGCEMHLWQPRKDGNLDCTFCLDCVHACPHENVGLLATVPAQSLWSDPFRSGVGRFSRRPDVAALVLVLVFGAFANAAGMIQPVVEWQDQLRTWMGDPPQTFVTTMFYLSAIVLIPLAAVCAATWLSRVWETSADSYMSTATRYSFALIPLGFAMWFAHYSFHFFTSYGTVIPATQRFASDLGWNALGDPLWRCACCRSAGEWIPKLEILMLDFGLLLSLYSGFRIAQTHARQVSHALKTFLPWALLIVLLFACGVWIVFQPMEMRGTLPATG